MRDISRVFAIGLVGAGGAAAQAAGLPIVDLGLTIHQATLNVSHAFGYRALNYLLTPSPSGDRWVFQLFQHPLR